MKFFIMKFSPLPFYLVTGFPSKILYGFLVFHVPATCSVHCIVCDPITIELFDKNTDHEAPHDNIAYRIVRLFLHIKMMNFGISYFQRK
jgi:hypothetical protein